MKLPKNPPWLVELFDSLLETSPTTRRKMFGQAAAFVNGNLSCGLFGASLFVRLDEAARTALLAEEGAAQFDPMGGRPMREYVVLPQKLLEDEPALRRWISRAVEHAGSLPPKKPAARKRAIKSGAASKAPAPARKRPPR